MNVNWFQHEYPYTNFHELNLDWIIKHFHEFIEEINNLESWRTTHETEYNQLLELYQEVKSNWDKFIAGDFPQSVYDAMRLWWVSNAVDLVGDLVRFVFFGLTEDGYFCAYIPSNWRDINFDTIMDFDDNNYGKLCIIY